MPKIIMPHNADIVGVGELTWKYRTTRNNSWGFTGFHGDRLAFIVMDSEALGKIVIKNIRTQITFDLYRVSPKKAVDVANTIYTLEEEEFKKW